MNKGQRIEKRDIELPSKQASIVPEEQELSSRSRKKIPVDYSKHPHNKTHSHISR
jgi:hypothetical protein